MHPRTHVHAVHAVHSCGLQATAVHREVAPRQLQSRGVHTCDPMTLAIARNINRANV